MLGPSPWVPEEDRQILQRIWHTLTSNWIQKWVANTLFWVGMIAFAGLMYTFASFECALHEECALASAHWANWLLSR